MSRPFRSHPRRAAGLVALALIGAAPLAAAISGKVLVAGSGVPGTPIGGALVHLQAQAAPAVFSAADGSFTLPVSPAGVVVVTASIPYLGSAPENFLTGGAYAEDGDVAIEIRLERLPAADDPAYEPAEYTLCGGCHVDQAAAWETSRHAFTGDNVWVRDLFSGDGTPGGAAGYVFKATHDPGEPGFCATCHTPMADLKAPGGPGTLDLDDPSIPAYGRQGVTCVTCHQMTAVDEGAIDALAHLGKASYRFPEDPEGGETWSYVWGPLDDVTFGAMRASHSPLHRTSLLCASCHQYSNPSTGAPGQNTYGEWLASPFAQPGPGFRTCQDCHMPPADGPGEICLFGGVERPAGDRRQHTFLGTTLETLQANLALATTAEELPGARLRVTAAVDNFGAGHSFPTGVSVRNALLVIEATMNGLPLAQSAGPTVPWWADDEVPGQQPGDYAGRPGKGFAKVLEGRINGEGEVVRPVLFIDAEGVAEDTLIPSGALDTTEVLFAIPPSAVAGDVVEISARLLWRRAWRAVAVEKGWTTDARGGPVEIEVFRDELSLAVSGADPSPILEIPALAPAGLAALAAALGAAALARLRRRRSSRRTGAVA